MTVSGLTMTRTSVQRDQQRRSVVQKRRSREFNLGRGRLRLSTATCCRRAGTSRAVSPRLRKKTRTTARMERMTSVTNSPVTLRNIDLGFWLQTMVNVEIQECNYSHAVNVVLR